MKLVKTFNPVKNIFTYIGMTIALIGMFTIVPMAYFFKNYLFIYVILLTLIDIFIHEHLHGLGAKLFKIDYIINFKKIIPTCTLLKSVNYKEMVTISILPIFLSMSYLILATLFYLFSYFYVYKILLFMSILSCAGMLGDFGYIIVGFRFRKNGIFTDQGKYLEIYQD